MAGKRAATSDLNHDNWDREEKAEDAGSFKKATDDVLQRRVIKTARRRNIASAATTEVDGTGEKKGVFGGFTGFAKTPSNPSTAFGFLAKPEINGTEKKTEIEKKPAPATAPPINETYLAKLKGLNESVSKWIKKHVDENPFINLTPIFGDYEKYFMDLELKKDLPNLSFGSTSNEPEHKIPFSFGVKANEEKKDTPLQQFSFGVKTSVESKVETPQFSFGSTSKTTLPNFNATSSTAGFTFAGGKAKPFVFADVSAPKPVENKDEEDEPPTVEFTPVVEDGHVYKIRCKVFVKKDGNFGDRGVGNLYLKPVPDSEKVQLIVRADTNLGNLLCNFILSEAIPMQRMGKKDVMLVCLPTPDSKPPPVPILLRVKSPEEADELLKTLKKHKK